MSLAAPSIPSWPLQAWVRPAAALAFVACAGYVGAIVWSGTASTVAAIARIGAAALCLGTVVCGATFLLRFLRWHRLLSALGHRVPAFYDLRVYLAGMALSSTPGKLGETFRSALLLPVRVPVSRSLAAFVADRLSDVIAVALLGAVAGWIDGRRQPVLEVIAVAAVVAGLLLSTLLRALPAATWSQPDGWLRRCARVRAPALAWAEAWQGWRPLGCVILGLGAYGLQAAVFAAYVERVAPDVGPAACIAIFASSTLIGAASLLPGGLGAMDSALALQLHDRGVDWSAAVGAALAVRASTLWFAWLLGLSALSTFAMRRGAVAAAGVSMPGR